MKTANEIRIDLANNQRMQKTKDKWIGWCEKYKERFTVVGNNNIKIGDSVNYTQQKGKSGGCIHISAKKGTVFAFRDDGSYMMVVTQGRLNGVRNQAEET